MSNPVLQSESFERAAYNLYHALDRFPGPNFQGAVDQFQRSVDKLARIEGMKAENAERQAKGMAQAYEENSFYNA